MAIRYTIFRNDKPIELECWASQYGMDFSSDVAVQLTDDEIIDIGYKLDEERADDWNEDKYKTGRAA